MQKRSPRYPRQNLTKSIEMVRKLFAGAHQSKVDVDAAARVIGYSGSTGGKAASAIGALRQYGLVNGLRGDVAVSELAMRILQPMNDRERVDAVREAAMKPEIFERIVAHFNGKLPIADDPIRSYLIRGEDFSAGGADDLIAVLRDTVSTLPDLPADSLQSSEASGTRSEIHVRDEPNPPKVASIEPQPSLEGELITLPLGPNCKAELRLVGEVTSASYGRLIKHLELLRQIAEEDGSA